MSDFLQAFESMIRNEGGYKLHSVEGDRGGLLAHVIDGRVVAGIAAAIWAGVMSKIRGEH